MLVEVVNFIAIPLVVAVIQSVLFAIILGKAGLPRWTAMFPFVQIIGLIGIYIAGGWITFYQLLAPIPLVIPLYQILMVLIAFIPLFILALSRWPAAVRQ